MQTNEYLTVFFLIITTSYAFIMREICEKGISGCKLARPSNPTFPGNQEELDETCTKAIEYFTCLAEFMDLCNEEDDLGTVNEGWVMVTATENVCDKDGEIYKGLVGHIDCIKDSLKNFNASCRSYAGDVDMSVAATDTMEHEDYLKMGCLRYAINIACNVGHIGESCGGVAEKASLDVVNEFKTDYEFCGGPLLLKIEELLQNLDLEESLVKRIEAVLNLLKD